MNDRDRDGRAERSNSSSRQPSKGGQRGGGSYDRAPRRDDQRQSERGPRREGERSHDRAPRRDGGNSGNYDRASRGGDSGSPDRGSRRDGSGSYDRAPRRDGDRNFSDRSRRVEDRGSARGPRREGDNGYDRAPRRDNASSYDRKPRRDGDGGFDHKPRRDGDRSYSDRPRRAEGSYDRAPRRDGGGSYDRKPRRDGDGGQDRSFRRDGERSFDRKPRRESDGSYDRAPRREGERSFDRQPRRDGDRSYGDRPRRSESGYDRGSRRDGDRSFEGRPRRDGDRSYGDRPRRDGERSNDRGSRRDNDRSFDRGPRRDDDRSYGDRPQFGRGGTRGGGRSDRGGSGRQFTEAERLQHELRPVRSEHDDPFIPEDVTPNDLHPSARNELKTLQPETAERVAQHLAMVGMIIGDDPELAHQHAISASRRAGRIPVARETLAVTAYHIGDYALALRELRTFRRLTGSQGHLALMVECERALGRPERGIETGLAAELGELKTEQRVQLAIAMSGARLDLGQTQQALFELEIPELDPTRAFSWSPELFAAYANVLEDLGREAESAQWRERALVAEAALEEHLGGHDEVEVIEVYEHSPRDRYDDAPREEYQSELAEQTEVDAPVREIDTVTENDDAADSDSDSDSDSPVTAADSKRGDAE